MQYHLSSPRSLHYPHLVGSDEQAVSLRPTGGHVTEVTAFIEVEGLSKRYRGGRWANREISFSAALGEVVAILGPNGAGKTTLALQLLGLMAPTAGRITIAGIDVATRPAELKKLVSYQPQGGMAMAGLEVGRMLRFTARLRGFGPAEARSQANRLAEEFDLLGVFGVVIRRLSGGMRRLVEVATAFAGAPKLVVLDEPTNDLDPAHRQLIWSRLNRLRQERSATCLVTTHNLLEAERVVDRVLIVRDGGLAAHGSPGELKQRFASSVLRLDLYVYAEGVVPVALRDLPGMLEVRPGHLRAYVSQEAVVGTLPLLLAEDARAWLDDFQLSPPSLEDVYFGLETIGAG